VLAGDSLESAIPLASACHVSWRKPPDDTLITPFTNPNAIRVVVIGGKIQTTWFVTDFGLRRGIKTDGCA
jgi:hypothetical protein